jgi:hypothetical protein
MLRGLVIREDREDEEKRMMDIRKRAIMSVAKAQED